MLETDETVAATPSHRRVLEDPSGRRGRVLRRAGRLIFVLFLAWLAAIVLGGLGLAPVSRLPFSRALRPSDGPPPAVLPAPRQPSANDLRPALPAPVLVPRGAGAAPTGRAKPAFGRGAPARGKSASAKGHTKRAGTTATLPRGKSGAARGQVRKTTTGATRPAPPGQARKTTTTVSTVPNGRGAANGQRK